MATEPEKKLKRMAPSILLDGVRLGAANLIYGVPMAEDTRILYGLVMLELADRYEISVKRESN
jgi:hypothetical protein